MTKEKFHNFLKEVYEFFDTSTIHGLAYLGPNHVRSTRVFWLLILLGATGIASYFLYQTVDGFGTKYTTTTIETRSIKEFSFPAVTFHPGDYNSRDSFLRKFLNQMKFTRFEAKSSMKDNDVFLKQFNWLVSLMHDGVLDGVEEYLLINEKEGFVKSKGKIFKNEVCTLLALQSRRKYLKNEIRRIFLENMYKYNEFRDLMNVIKRQVAPIIMEAKSHYNLSKTEVTSTCNDPKKLQDKTKIESMLLSYMFLFIDKANTGLRAGDLATSTLNTGLSQGDERQGNYNSYYHSTHKLLTSMYNGITNASLPVSILEFPHFFVKPDQLLQQRINSSEVTDIVGINRIIEHINIPDETMIIYHFLWLVYNNNNIHNLTLYCTYKNTNNCSEFSNFLFPSGNKQELNYIRFIKRNPKEGKIIETLVSEPPCRDENIIGKFKMKPICNLLRNVFIDKESFLKLMMATKQSPVFESEEEYQTYFKHANKTFRENGYIYSKKKVFQIIVHNHKVMII